MHFVLDIVLQRNNRPVGQTMKKFERNTGRKLPNAEPVSIISRSLSDALGGQGRMLGVGFVLFFEKENISKGTDYRGHQNLEVNFRSETHIE